jgi:hypothetical protein
MTAPIFHPGHPCPRSGCPGRLKLERHLGSCECADHWNEPCASCRRIIAELLVTGAVPDSARLGPRPWIICSHCNWMERDGGLTGHEMLVWMARVGARAPNPIRQRGP